MKTLLTLLLLLAGLGAAAQNKITSPPKMETTPKAVTPPKIIGIGRLQIGVTTIDSLVSIVGLPLDTSSVITGHLYKQAKKTEMVELIKPVGEHTQYLDTFAREFVPCYRIVRLTEWKLQDLALHDIRLTFLHDTLMSFRSDIALSLIGILSREYGPPEIISERPIVSCVDKLTGLKSDFEGEITDITWKEGECSATIFISNNYNSKCEKESSSSFTMKNTTMYDGYRKMIRKTEKATNR